MLGSPQVSRLGRTATSCSCTCHLHYNKPSSPQALWTGIVYKTGGEGLQNVWMKAFAEVYGVLRRTVASGTNRNHSTTTRKHRKDHDKTWKRLHHGVEGQNLAPEDEGMVLGSR